MGTTAGGGGEGEGMEAGAPQSSPSRSSVTAADAVFDFFNFFSTVFSPVLSVFDFVSFPVFFFLSFSPFFFLVVSESVGSISSLLRPCTTGGSVLFTTRCCITGKDSPGFSGIVISTSSSAFRSLSCPFFSFFVAFVGVSFTVVLPGFFFLFPTGSSSLSIAPAGSISSVLIPAPLPFDFLSFFPFFPFLLRFSTSPKIDGINVTSCGLTPPPK
mmetsp:Transcript_22386/g.22574  ORF Transcript_22386/g.22574 Transcript_22386/m.22574 type:complete len:214 (-) Transcript_22386:2516-3157(-)